MSAQCIPDLCLNQPRQLGIVNMSIETVVSLPEDIKAALDHRAPNPSERNKLIAAALRAYFAWPRAVINAHSDELNAETEDVLSYQVPLCNAENCTSFSILARETQRNSESS